MAFVETKSEKLFLLFGFIFILISGFFSGYSYSQEKAEKEEITIEGPVDNCAGFIFQKNETSLGSQVNGDNVSNQEISGQERASGAFVASKNSKLYHKADCVYVKRIKEENKIFFNSAQEAENRGLTLHSGE